MNANHKVGVLVVDDSALCRRLIIDALSKDPDLEVVGEAANGEEAVQQVSALKPAVVTMDVDMPVLDGLTATERIMSDTPVPILVLTADPRHEAPALTHRALAVGALALQVKPALDAGPEAWNLAKEVKLLSTVKVIRHLRVTRRPGTSASSLSAVHAMPAAPVTSAIGVLAVSASTGGPQVLQKALSELPADFPVPVVIAQQINAAFVESMVGWVANTSKLQVRVAKDGDLLTPGVVLFAPPDSRLTIAARGRVAVKPGSDDGAGTALLESAAQVYARRTAGLLLTGLGHDGVEGLAAIRRVGGVTLAQSLDSAMVPARPGEAISRGLVDHQVNGDDLGRVLLKLVRGELTAAGR